MAHQSTVVSENREQSPAVDDREAARILGQAVQTLRNWRFLRKGPPWIKQGRSVRYLLEDIQAYKLKNRIDPEDFLR
jgi:predicted DNA-binding transcriptional regulator AlpA